MLFANRTDAARKLAEALTGFSSADTVIYAIPRGGVVIGAEVASRFGLPLGLVFPFKIRHPLSPEYAVGAVTETGDPIWGKPYLAKLENPWLDRQVELARSESARRRTEFNGSRAEPDPAGKTLILVDDGMATGLTMKAAIAHLRRSGPAKIIAAVPVAPRDAPSLLSSYADEFVVLHLPQGYFGAISAYYRQFGQTSDKEVRSLLRARQMPQAGPPDVGALLAVVDSVKRFPVTAADLAARARRLHAPESVVNFFESIPTSLDFKDKPDVMRRSEQVGQSD
jgi:putative phosphoribosyl transferase